MNWGDYFVGMVSGLGIGASVIGFITSKTINSYKKIVADYEVMVAQLIYQLTGVDPCTLGQILVESNFDDDEIVRRLDDARRHAPVPPVAP